MKKIFALLFTILISNQIFAQTENYRAKIDQFQTKYNAGKYDEIFNSFSREMKQALPLESTKEFLNNLKLQAGKIESKEFIKYEQETYASYKTKFEKAVLSVNISLDENSQIDGLFVKPYKGSATSEVKNTVNILSIYPQKIAQIVYSKAKDFPNSTQVSIAVIKDGKTNYYGIVKENDSIKPIENQSKVFEIGSITKVFTSTVLASLVEDKKINLSDHINKYYHLIFKDNINISFESLANHTSGLPRLPENLDLSNESNPYQNYGRKKLEDYLRNSLTLKNKPSTSYDYSNLGAGLLGYTLGLSQKTSIQELLKKKIFDKYKMTNSFTNSQNLGEKLVKGLDINGKIIPNWDFDVLFGGGGILSTTEDLAKFAAAQFDPKNKELALTRTPTFDISEKMKIGLGWHVLKSENGQNLFWHNGGAAGYSSSITMNTDNKTAVIILSNVSAFNPIENIDPLCFELMQELKK
ncbi:penicillin-binding protein [Chryseobacterium formosense]|uniref:Penicillin-binding protein n=1 Tax=Chryseobacterium formosense TaxID=236814 RepID=A0A085ZA72_9FLAO|nr:serine hydrolase [Chryseobacterium formosense]KFF01336.1 penicillin-binding protein [Chryseobacterium formosense]SFT45815.1 CubicO group peptidase, beta-lactamase class C family [Chryseobacterium formosense]